MSSRGYRGRGRGRGGRFQPSYMPDPLTILQEGLSDREVDSIPFPASVSGTSEKVEATNVVALGSYNWVDHTTPTLMIPGSPSLWKEPSLPMQLDPDSGNSFIDQNTARLPLNPFEPMLRAINITQKQLGNDFDLANENIDIITDRNNLRKLMRFITYHGPNRDPRPGSNRGFRIDVQLAPNDRTLVLTRRDEKVIDDSTRFKGYGHNFEKATTEQATPFLATNQNRTHISRLTSSGHHRITRYDLLGLRFLVRYEVDAMMLPTETPSPDNPDDADELDILSKALALTSLSDTKVAAEPKPKPKSVLMPIPKKPETIAEIPGSELRHVAQGELVSQAQVLELRTVKSVFQVPWTDMYPQLFLSQTPTVKLAKQLDGRIETIQTYTKESQEMQAAHDSLAPDFVTLSAVLMQTRDVAKKHKSIGRPLAVFWDGQGDLKIRVVQQDGHLLSGKDLAKF